MILDEGTALLGNGNFFTARKQNATPIKHFGPIYMYFDEYPPYSGVIYNIFETNINDNI